MDKRNLGNFGKPEESMADSDRFDEQCKKEIEGNLGNLEPIWDEPFLFSEAVLPEIRAGNARGIVFRTQIVDFLQFCAIIASDDGGGIADFCV